MAKKTPKWLEHEMAILAALAVKAMTAAQLMEATGLNAGTIKPVMARLRDAGRIHVVDWVMVLGAKKASMVFRPGPGVDIPYPRGIGNKPHNYARVTERDLSPDHGWKPIRKAADAPIIQRDPFTTALFGKYRGVPA